VHVNTVLIMIRSYAVRNLQQKLEKSLLRLGTIEFIFQNCNFPWNPYFVPLMLGKTYFFKSRQLFQGKYIFWLPISLEWNHQTRATSESAMYFLNEPYRGKWAFTKILDFFYCKKHWFSTAKCRLIIMNNVASLHFAKLDMRPAEFSTVK